MWLLEYSKIFPVASVVENAENMYSFCFVVYKIKYAVVFNYKSANTHRLIRLCINNCTSSGASLSELIAYEIFL